MNQVSKLAQTDSAMAKEGKSGCETLSLSLLPEGSSSSRQPFLTFQNLFHYKLPEKELLLL